MGISKKQFTLAAKAGLTREQAARFIGTAGQEPSPTEAYDKVGQLLKGRTPGQAIKQVQPEFNKPTPKPSALTGIKPIEPEVSKSQPLEQPKTVATNVGEMIKPVEQPKKFEKRVISQKIPEKYRNNENWKKFEELDLGQQDPKSNTIFSLFDKGDNPFEQFGASFYYSTDGDYMRSSGTFVELSIKDKSNVETIIHEIGHLVDTYCGKKLGQNKNYMSEEDNFTNVIERITNLYNAKDKNTEQKLVNFYNDVRSFYMDESLEEFSKYVPTYKEIYNKYDNLSNEEIDLLRKSFSGKLTPEELTRKQEIAPITKQLRSELDAARTKYGYYIGKDLASSMSDIISALTMGGVNRSTNRLKIQVIGHHSTTYWKQIPKRRNREIFTHYLSMKAHPNKKFLESFKKHWPELNVELERLYDQAYQIMGGK